MGLDMYLYARKGIASIDWLPERKLNADYTILTSLMGASDWAYDPEELAFAQVSIQVGYWRKVTVRLFMYHAVL